MSHCAGVKDELESIGPEIHFCLSFRGGVGFLFASRAATALRARARRSAGVIEAAAFLARAVRSSAVIEAAAFFPPLLPCFRKNSMTSGGNFFLGTLSA